MIKVFISHKQEDSYTANKIANELKAMNVTYYLDILDFEPEEFNLEMDDGFARYQMVECLQEDEI